MRLLPANCKHLWCRVRYALGFGIEWRMNDSMKAQCVRCGHVFEPVTFDMPEDT
jgi:hypothetical protein